ncbi:MAG TPA: Flp pilus assembly protein CpaB, partial [Candidatus Baltobacteraceae bacterium]|jgi:pilus assembly protein CpaB|nr:Flp pilus assembly protein CpaB [Candidatus Baltobacteraceae bacterium]
MNIPANTKIVPAMVTTEQKPTDQVDATALSDPADAVGMLAAADIPQGVVLTPTRLARPVAPPQGLQVAVGTRAVTIAVDNVKGVAGLLVPGDHVDVLAAPLRGGNELRAYAIVRDARVLAVGRNIGTPEVAPTGSPAPGPKPTTPPNTWITLAVTPPQADSIMAADLGGVVRLALRSAHEPGRSLAPEPIIYASEEKRTGPAGPPKPQGVVVVNGSQVTRVIP